MHVVIGFLTALVTIFYLLDRLGIDVGGLNPFHWYRRRAFARRFGSDPIYSIEDPVHVAALLIIGAAKLDGDLTADQKATALRLFQTEFSIGEQEANQLFGSAAHLLAAPQLLDNQLRNLVGKNEGRFSQSQASSLINMMVETASADKAPSAAQSEFINTVRSQLLDSEVPKSTWA